MEKDRHVYQLELTERQARALSHACDQFSRLICGQNWPYQGLFEAAWEKRCKEATGNTADKEWDGGWNAMRADAESLCRQAKERFWGLGPNTFNGIGYDDTADILSDLHQVLRHQLWLDSPDGRKTHATVDSYEARRRGTEPLAKIKRTE